MYNKGHVPDIIEIDAVDTLYEVKCWTPITDQKVPGAGARLDEEGRRRLDQRGLAHRLRRHPGERAPPHPRLQAARHGGPEAPFDHATGVGYVAGHTGHYADALAKGRQVVLIVVETTGAVHPDAIGMLYGWHAEARVEGCLDRTVYGASRSRAMSRARPDHILLHAPPAPHLARRSDRRGAPRSDRRGAPRRHLGKIQEISPP